MPTPDATVVFLGMYNPFSIGFGPAVGLEGETDAIVDRVNGVASEVAKAKGMRFADGQAVLKGRTGAVTHMLAGRDIHPRPIGYDLLAQAIAGVLGFAELRLRPKFLPSGTSIRAGHGAGGGVARDHRSGSRYARCGDPAADDDEGLGPDELALALLEWVVDDHVRQPELVFEEHEHDAAGRARALAGDDHAGNLHLGASGQTVGIARPAQVVAGDDAFVQERADEGHGWGRALRPIAS